MRTTKINKTTTSHVDRVFFVHFFVIVARPDVKRFNLTFLWISTEHNTSIVSLNSFNLILNFKRFPNIWQVEQHGILSAANFQIA